MRKTTGFRKGYCIRIFNGFYEVADGNKAIFYGKCRKNSTIEEIANKTIELRQEGRSENRRRIRVNN